MTGPITLRFHAQLNQFLRPEQRERTVTLALSAPAPVRHLAETLGVPHTEIDRVLLQGQPVSLEAQVCAGDAVELFPAEPGLASSVRPPPPAPPRFVVDAHLGQLAKYLRWLGFDARCDNDVGDRAIASTAAAERRVVLSRDRALLMRREILYGFYVPQTDPWEQLREVVARWQLCPLVEPFSRCMECNQPLRQAAPRQVLEKVPQDVRRWETQYLACPGCGRVYWRGSHYDAMRERLRALCPGQSQGSRSGD